jgi:hypothetical protein
MLDAPKQDWPAYERAAAPNVIKWLRRLTPDERLALYDDMFGLVASVPRTSIERKRLEDVRWREKVARRLVEVNAYRKLDELRREHINTHDAR